MPPVLRAERGSLEELALQCPKPSGLKESEAGCLLRIGLQASLYARQRLQSSACVDCLAGRGMRGRAGPPYGPHLCSQPWQTPQQQPAKSLVIHLGCFPRESVCHRRPD